STYRRRRLPARRPAAAATQGGGAGGGTAAVARWCGTLFATSNGADLEPRAKEEIAKMPSYVIMHRWGGSAKRSRRRFGRPASLVFLIVEPTCPSESALPQSKYFPSTTTPAGSFGAREGAVPPPFWLMPAQKASAIESGAPPWRGLRGCCSNSRQASSRLR